jgi:hypothetical protein
MNETQIHLRLSEGLRQDVQTYADAFGTSVAAAARILIRKGLDASEPIFKLHAEGVIQRRGEQS